MLLAVNAWPHHSVSRFKCKRNQRSASGPASPSSAAADMEMQLPATDKRTVGTVEDSETEDG